MPPSSSSARRDAAATSRPPPGFVALERRMARLLALAVLLVAAARPRRAGRRPCRHAARSGARDGALGRVFGRLRRGRRHRPGAVLATAPTWAAMPASVEKLYTSATALLHYGAEGRLTTSVLADGAAGRDRARSPATSSCAAAATRRSAPRRPPRWRAQLVEAGLMRIDGQVIGDESAFDAFRGPSELPHRVLGRPAQRAVVQPRPHRQAAPVLPGQPGPVRGAGVREGARARGRADHREGPRGHHAGGDDAVLGVELAAGRDDRAPDEPAVGQLHRRDADQGARVRVRHGGLDGRRRRRGAPDACGASASRPRSSTARASRAPTARRRARSCGC